MEEKSNSLLIIQMVLVFASTVATLALVRKALSFHNRLWLALLVFVGSTIAFTYLGVAIPLFFFGNADRVQYSLSIDLMMYSAIGLLFLGIIAFALDHAYEWPTCLMIAAAAVFAIGLSPLYYRFQTDKLNQEYGITVVDPIPPKETMPPPDSGGWFR